MFMISTSRNQLISSGESDLIWRRWQLLKCSFFAQVLDGGVYMVGGGFHFDGQRAITSLNRTEIDETVKKIRESNIKNVVISGLFSPVNNQQEIQVNQRDSS